VIRNSDAHNCELELCGILNDSKTNFPDLAIFSQSFKNRFFFKIPQKNLPGQFSRFYVYWDKQAKRIYIDK